EARPSPRHPCHGVAVALLHQLLAIAGGGQSDDGVGVHVVAVRGRQEGVERRVDGWWRAAGPEAAVVKEGEGAVVVFFGDGPDPFEDQRRQTIALEGGKVTS